MYYSAVCPSPLGMLTLGSDGEHLIGLWLEGQKYFGGACGRRWRSGTGFPSLTRRGTGWPGILLEKSRCPPNCPCAPLAGSSDSGYGGCCAKYLRRNHDLWSSCPGAGGADGKALHVQPGSGRRGGPQPHLHHHSLPPGRGLRRQPHRVCRGIAAKLRLLEHEAWSSPACPSPRGARRFEPWQLDSLGRRGPSSTAYFVSRIGRTAGMQKDRGRDRANVSVLICIPKIRNLAAFCPGCDQYRVRRRALSQWGSQNGDSTYLHIAQQACADLRETSPQPG